jgi:hypothetical protein
MATITPRRALTQGEVDRVLSMHNGGASRQRIISVRRLQLVINGFEVLATATKFDNIEPIGWDDDRWSAPAALTARVALEQSLHELRT